MKMLSDQTKSRTLFLWLNCNEFHAVNAAKSGVKISNVYRHTPKILKALRRLQIKLNIFSVYPWLDSWANNLDAYDTVIIHASKLTPPVVKFINRKNPYVKVIVWYWNPIAKTEPISSFSSYKCEIWTFDEEDSRQYGINHNTQYYFKNIILKEHNPSNDVLFVGGDKARLSFLIKVQSELELLGLSTDFHIVGTPKISNNSYDYKKRIDYSEVLEKIKNSKAILDIVSDNQIGLTLRPLEALFFSKKLITNDKTIVNRDFYDPNNIFVLEYDDISNILDFINRPFERIESEILGRYDFEQWLTRFNDVKSI